MPREEGIVSRTIRDRALVVTQRSAECESCVSVDACRMLGGSTDMEVEALNIAGAAAGDRVQLDISGEVLLTASFLVYMVPVLGLIAGAIFGHHVALSKGWDHDGLAFLAGAAGFALSFVLVKLFSGRASISDAYVPRVVKIVRRAAPVSPAEMSALKPFDP